jgi:hypothetical protein
MAIRMADPARYAPDLLGFYPQERQIDRRYEMTGVNPYAMNADRYVSGLLTDPTARAEFGTGLLQGATTDLAAAPVDIYESAVDMAQGITPQNNQFNYYTNPFWMLSQSGNLAEKVSSVAGSEALGEAVYGKPPEGYGMYRNPARVVGGVTGAGELALGKVSAEVAPYVARGVNYLTDAMPRPQAVTPEGLLMDVPQQAPTQPQTLLMEGNAQDVTSVSRMDDVDELGFYSVALDAAKKLPMNKGTGQQFRKMLENAGVKKDEITFTPELDDLLSQDRVTKEELVDVIERNRVRLSETVLEGSGLQDLEFRIDDQPIPFRDVEDDEYIYDRSVELLDELQFYNDELISNALTDIYDEETSNRIISHLENKSWQALDSIDQEFALDAAQSVLESQYLSNPAFRYTDNAGSNIEIRGNDDIGYTVYDRDVPVNNDYIASLNEAMVQAENYAYDANIISSPENSAQYAQYKERGGQNYKETLVQIPDEFVLGEGYEGRFVGDHYTQENVGLHIRTTDRIMAKDAGDVLYVEELQSDWAQTGRNTGFSGGEDYQESISKIDAEIQSKRDDYDQKQKILDDYLNNYKISIGAEKIGDADIRDLRKFDPVFNDIYVDAKDAVEIYQLAKREKNKLLSAPPLAPFVGKTEKWTELAIKKLINQAIKENKKYVSFSSGDVQYGRWRNEGLVKYYDEIIPKVAKSQVKKLDPDAFVGMSDVRMTNFSDKEPRFTIEITPKMREKAKSGLPLFAIPAGTVVGAGLLTGEKEPQSQGLL